jgi:hypothetical protein
MKRFTVKFSYLIFTVLIVLNSCSPEDGMDGLSGEDGLNSLVKTMIELPGNNCVNGGYIIQFGLDTNKNSVLDANEVVGSEYLCNPEDTSNFKTYVSLISQTSENNPTSVVLENTLNLNISWLRESRGKYIGTTSASIDINKTVVFYTTPTTHTGVRGEIVGNNQIRMELQNGINAFEDNFNNLSFELRVYE